MSDFKQRTADELHLLLTIDCILGDGITTFAGTDIEDAIGELNLDEELKKSKINTCKLLIRGSYLAKESIAEYRPDFNSYIKSLGLTEEQFNMLRDTDG